MAKNITKTCQIKKLEDATQLIMLVEEGTRRNLYTIASTLAIVDQNKMYEENHYKSTSEYGEAVFGYKRQTTSALVRVAYRFIDGSESRFKVEDQKDYTIYQLMELLPLDNEQIEKCIEEGELNPYMTTKSIRDLVKSYKTIPCKTSNQEVEKESNQEVEKESNQEVEKESNQEVEKEKEDIIKINDIIRRVNSLKAWIKTTNDNDNGKKTALHLTNTILTLLEELK